jgi:hypothetical protein
VPLLPAWVPDIAKIDFSIKLKIIYLAFSCGDFNNSFMHYRDASKNTELFED